MRSPGRFAALLLFLASHAVSQTITPEERERALRDLQTSGAAFNDAIRNVTKVQWGFRPGANTPSIAEIATHALAQEIADLETAVRVSRSEFIATKGARQQDDLLVQMVRENREPAPLHLIDPSTTDKVELTRRFRETHQRAIAFVESTRDDLRLRFFPHPVYGTLDAYQWILTMAAETSRYTAQIRKIEESPGYPK